MTECLIKFLDQIFEEQKAKFEAEILAYEAECESYKAESQAYKAENQKLCEKILQLEKKIASRRG